MLGSNPVAPPATAAKDASTRAGEAERDEASVTAAVVTINRPAQELYEFWRDLSNLSGVMENIERIEVRDGTRSHWVVKAPGDRAVEWDATITEDQPGKLIAWTSDDGADVRNSGRVEFHQVEGRGTVVRAVIAYDPPLGAIGKLFAKLFQREPAIQARRDLRRFKQLMETGEIATSSRTLAHHAEHKAG
ncbi:SRPBCC family protein [Sphingomonas bacterium]|uniref:SRPBCC family protein n=1 Tax=Sphingomonas bacterium TaxID=1895847 RepID=UPI0015753E39|nr:SRPBCC family protein [Sphingomonas bacterium]